MTLNRTDAATDSVKSGDIKANIKIKTSNKYEKTLYSIACYDSKYRAYFR